MNRRLSDVVGLRGSGLRFTVLFAGLTLMMAAIYDAAPSLLGYTYLVPVTYTAYGIAHAAGIDADLDCGPANEGYCELSVGGVEYVVSHACTGLFTCSLFVAACLAFPAPLRRRIMGLAVGIPAFMTFGTMRLVIMVLVALLAPTRIDLFHTYIMTIANLGFAMFIWVNWLREPNSSGADNQSR